MNYKTFLNQVIKTGVVGVKKDYKKPTQKLIREGSLAGFEACQNKTPLELSNLLVSAGKESHKKMMEQSEDYWYYRGFLLEVEWVCNVVSAMLMNQGKSVIITPTARGVLAAGKILGVKQFYA